MHVAVYCWAIGCLAIGMAGAFGQATPLQTLQNQVNYNPSSERGMPISESSADYGSDGRAPSQSQQIADNLPTSPATGFQFRSAVNFGQVLWRPNATHNNVNRRRYPSDAVTDANTTIQLRRAAIGAPYVSRAVSFLIGAQIAPPDVDENEDALVDQTGEEYWFPEPHDSGNANNRYYWSPHAQTVFATEAGSVSVIWIKRQAESSTPADSADTTKWLLDGGSYFRKFEQTYLVSGSTIKDPQTIYWNYASFDGPTVEYPEARVGDVHIAYTANFPASVPDVDAEVLLALGNDVVREPRTLWVEENSGVNQIRALNQEGRVFLELLGDLNTDNTTREHIGFEIIDVLKYPTPTDDKVELGEVIRPASTDATAGEWLPVVKNVLDAGELYYSHALQGTELPVLYATTETENVNDLLIHWMAPSVAGIRWPALFVRYESRWPTDVSKYHQYVRPAAASDAAASATAVQLVSDELPTIESQDFPNTPRARLTQDGLFFTRLDASIPAHRTLLRFQSDDHVKFERVFSWLDDSLRSLEEQYDTGLTAVGSVKDGNADSVGTVYSLDNPSAVEVVNGIAYVASDTSDNVSILDVSDPARVKVLSVVQHGVDGHELNGVDGLEVSGNLLVTLANAAPPRKFSIYDVSNPSSPVRKAKVDPGVGIIYAAFIDGNHLYLSGHLDVVAIYDISDPGNPTLIHEIHHDVAESGQIINVSNVRAIQVVDDVAYFGADQANRLLIVNVADPASPTLLAELIDGANGYEADQITSLTVDNGILYFVSQSEDTLTLVDVGHGSGSPGSPQKLGEYKHGAFFTALDAPTRLTVADGRLYVASRTSGSLSVVDVSNPASPVLLQTLLSSDGSQPDLTTAQAVAVEDRRVFVAGGDPDALTIFEYLPGRLAGNAFAGTVATDLDSYDSVNAVFDWVGIDQAPRVVQETVEVGQRIVAPDGESGSDAGDSYLAGHINQEIGTSFNSKAYVDPLDANSDFEAANLGAIIPVNAIPNQNELEVWWMRSNNPDTDKGFGPAYWPAAIGKYTITWPSDPAEIVLASGEGSGPLSSLAAAGDVYYQNDASLPGYNPNEEHALMSGGQAFALRDDLNITENQNVNANNPVSYSSEPYVLVEYTAADGRPAMIPFRVLREKPEAGLTFDYPQTAPIVLQPPMPLPLLTTVSEELGRTVVTASTFNATTEESVLTVSERPRLVPLEHLLLENTGTDGSGEGFYVTDVDYLNNQLEGYVTLGEIREVSHSELEFTSFRVNETTRLRGQRFDASVPIDKIANNSSTRYLYFHELDYKVLLISAEEARVQAFDLLEATEDRLTVHLPNATLFDQERGAMESATHYAIIKPDVANGDYASGATEWRLTPTLAVDAGNADVYDSYTLLDRKGNRWIYRGPHDENDGDRFQVRYYYETINGFHFPGEATQPAIGSRTPYLRAANSSGGFVGATLDNTDDIVDPYPVTYLPVWPDNPAQLNYAESLTLPRRGLPAVRGNSSVEIVYDQAFANANGGTRSVVLHDPTREKEYQLGTTVTDVDDNTVSLDAIPGSVATETYNGDTFFPQLPPHLSQRFFLDPNRGTGGALVFRGEFVDQTAGEDYLLLNVAGVKDLEALHGLCATNDAEYASWVAAINNLKATVELFVENTAVPGTFIADAGSSRDVLVDALVEVDNDDIAVDSYALTATGQGSGFVSILRGNGLAFTAEDDPVDVQVFQVSDKWHQGEAVVIVPPNPLSEKVTVQQVVDLAGTARDVDGSSNPLFAYDWRLAAPEDGGAPPVFDNRLATLFDAGSMTHLPLPAPSDAVSNAGSADAARTGSAGGTLRLIESLPVASATATANGFQVTLSQSLSSLGSGGLLAGNRLLATDAAGDTAVFAVTLIHSDVLFDMDLFHDNGGESVVDDVALLTEHREADIPQSYLHTTFTAPDVYSGLWFSLNLDPDLLGARVYVNGTEVVSAHVNRFVSSVSDSATAAVPDGLDPPFAPVGDAYVVDTGVLSTDGSPNEVVVALYAGDTVAAGASLTFQLKIEALQYVDIAGTSSKWLPMDGDQFLDGIRAIIGGKADVQSLGDQHVIMRYGPANPNYTEGDDITTAATEWSEWTAQKPVEGWIKRVLAGINPFNQRTTDLFNNAVESDASMLTLAGKRWEGDVALNSETINDFGLIEIYETVLNRGRDLSIDAGINYGPANDALLLAAGYINDLYTFLGNEAQADALNPTIGIGTADGELGDIATSLFAFKGQVASLLDEELALLRGRDDFLQPDVEATPVYNRLFWNYTRGIDSGEVIYALNYNIQEDQDDDFDGIINAEDAAKMFPQGHGDAYGHYLTALKGYYSLLMNPSFDWVPRSEQVLILNQAVDVDYTDERKFAAAAASVAKVGKQVFDLTWRKDYQTGGDNGWEHFGAEKIRDNSTRLTSRHWGLDHWASRSGQGAFVNWVAGNAMLPELDTDPTHEGIQVIDRTTVPELAEIADLGRALQVSADNADAQLNPLGMSEGSIPFDVNPTAYSFWHGGDSSHFEDVYDRAKAVLNNAVIAFDDAKDVTRLLRSDTDSLAEFQAEVDSRELAFTNALIEIYGTPFADDIGVGKTYATGYEGPDLLHYSYVNLNEISQENILGIEDERTFTIDTQTIPDDWSTAAETSFNFLISSITSPEDYASGNYSVSFTLGPHGYFGKPSDWTGRRESSGKIQMAISDIIKSRNAARASLQGHEDIKYRLDRQLQVFEAMVETHDNVIDAQRELSRNEAIVEALGILNQIGNEVIDGQLDLIDQAETLAISPLAKNTVVGTSSGGDISRPAVEPTIRSAAFASERTLWGAKLAGNLAYFGAVTPLHIINTSLRFDKIAKEEFNQERRERILEIDLTLKELNASMMTMYAAAQELDDAMQRYQTLVAEGNRIQRERQVFRQRASAVIQGFRTRDAAFRIFRDEKLERYNALFDLAARYAFLAAKTYDYETGLLHTDEGRNFIDRIVSSRALGVVADGEPQFAGSNTGDPGLSSALAEMSADFGVLKGRLGLNNPDAYGTTVSLRTENFRILPGSGGDTEWRDVLESARTANLLQDEDVVRNCLQINTGDGLPVPGLVIEFSTQITPGFNLFGRPLAGGDHAFDSSLFATKIYSAGVVLAGYNGMDNPSANASVTGNEVSDPTASFLDPTALSATPYVYLIPVGMDAMRSPPLGDQSVIRTFAVEDVTIPLPFNIGASEFSTKKLYQSADSLTETLFEIRKHQAFRPVSDDSLLGENAQLLPTFYTNTRLIGRSVWNTKWKLVIPGRTLLNDPEQGLDVLIDTLNDIKLHFETYSYSGN